MKDKQNNNCYHLTLDKEYYGGVNKVFETKDLAKQYLEEHIPSEVWDKVLIFHINKHTKTN
jgi:hypothetical protein